jgi:hypothetical protein
MSLALDSPVEVEYSDPYYFAQVYVKASLQETFTLAKMRI